MSKSLVRTGASSPLTKKLTQGLHVMTLCPCGSGKTFDECCAPILAGAPALTAESLMRSRYTACVKGDAGHLERSCAKGALDEFNREEIERYIGEMAWRGLEVLSLTEGGRDDEKGRVDFVFHMEYKGEAYTQREIAVFERIEGRWYYTGGEVNPRDEPARAEKIGRNDPCPCGSGKKFKKCCWNS